MLSSWPPGLIPFKLKSKKQRKSLFIYFPWAGREIDVIDLFKQCNADRLLQVWRRTILYLRILQWMLHDLRLVFGIFRKGIMYVHAF